MGRAFMIEKTLPLLQQIQPFPWMFFCPVKIERSIIERIIQHS